MRSVDARLPFLRAVLGAATVSAAAGCTPAERSENDPGMTPLFDGRTLSGWTQRGGNASYTVQDGCIVGRTAPDQPNSFLCTTRAYRDFELRLRFKVDRELNSGVQIRSESTPAYRNGVVHGYQVEIDPSDRAWTGGLYDESGRGWLVDLKDKPEARRAFVQGEWNSLRIIARGDTFSTWLNGVPVVQEFHDATTREGFIALQVHGVGARAEPLEIRWRDLWIRELD